MVHDPAAHIAALRATIASCTRKLNAGVTQIAENGRMMRVDLTVVQGQLDTARAELAALAGTRPPIRRYLVTTRSRGY